MDRLRMDDACAIVTGAGRGIGAAVAKLLADRGARVVCNYRRDRASAEEVVSAIRGRGGAACTFGADVADPADAQRLVDAASAEFGPLRVLVNNAGILSRESLWEHSFESRQAVLSVNLGGTFNCCQAALPDLISTAPSAIVNISSIAGTTGDLTAAPSYGASKGGVNALTKSLARQVAGYGVRVNAVAPHAIETDMSGDWSPEQRRQIVDQIPLGRLGRPDDVAEAVCFLASSAAAFVTGEIMDVNGGYWMD